MKRCFAKPLIRVLMPGLPIQQFGRGLDTAGYEAEISR
jgi:hypothetical protein